MKIAYIIHADFEKPGFIETWAKKNNHKCREYSSYKGESLPQPNEFDFLVVMGGPQSPLSMEKSPYLKNEIDLIKKALAQNKCIIGICLGAQLIGEALGAKTERSPYREIGVFPIMLLDGAKSDPIFSKLPRVFDVMHWHNDMPGLPIGAELIAKSEGCPRQIFRYGDRVYGFQCHFEMTKDLAQGMIANCPDDLINDKYVRNREELLTTDYDSINLKLEKVLDHLTKVHNQSNVVTTDTVEKS